jgi:carbon starvation protein
LALGRGESVNAGWLLFAAIASYAIAYRFYARFIQRRVLETDDNRATPGERLDNGRDFEPMDRRILFGHHFAAIAGAGPLVGPVLAAQMGFLPGTIWIIVGVILAGAVQDMTILFFSMRRDGKTLGQMAREEIGPVGGAAALVAVLAIMVILLAVLALVVVNALANSPWGTFSIAMTLPIALLMGFYLRFLRPGRILEVSAIGVGLLILALIGGGWISSSGYVGPPGSTRLPLDVYEDRDHRPPRRRHLHRPADDADASAHPVCLLPDGRTRGAGGSPLPVRVHNRRLRSPLGLPLADSLGHYPKTY